MIRTCVLDAKNNFAYDVPIEEVLGKDIKWCWVDFTAPSEEETSILNTVFKFHPLAIEDSLDHLKQRPKLDFYDQYIFTIIHAIHQSTFSADEVDLFVSDKFIVTVHKKAIREVSNLWDKVKNDEANRNGPFFIMHAIIDQLVDDYFPALYEIEARLNAIEDNSDGAHLSDLMEELFGVRADLSKLRRTILPMRDLLYRIVHSERLNQLHENQLYFHDVHDHLLKLVEMLESYRDFSSDLRDSYLSVNSNNMNTIMATLTIITTIFMPLTFLAGVYGMNFKYMPELEWRYGYYLVLGIMASIAVGMVYFFKRKGWLKIGNKTKRNKGRKINMH